MALIFTVAIDGPAAAGKGTIARAVAAHFGFTHLDTGLLYRAVGMKMLEAQAEFDEKIAADMATNLQDTDIARPDLRTPQVAQAASKVAAMPEVRAALLLFQQQFAKREGGAVLDGRDIGTVVCPEAQAKLFVTADAATRAQRRFEELSSKGLDVSLEQVEADMAMRDARDAERDIAPMMQARDALLLDTTKLSIDAAIEQAVAMITTRLP